MCLQSINTFKCKHAEFGALTGCENRQGTMHCSAIERKFVHKPELCWSCLHPRGIQRVQHPCDVEVLNRLNASQGWHSESVLGGQYMNQVKQQMYPNGIPGGVYQDGERGGIISLGGQAAWAPHGVQMPNGKFAFSEGYGRLPFIVQGGQPPTEPGDGYLIIGPRGLQLAEGAEGRIIQNAGKMENMLQPMSIAGVPEEEWSILPPMLPSIPSDCQLGSGLGTVNMNQDSLSMANALDHCRVLLKELLPDSFESTVKKHHGPTIRKESCGLSPKRFVTGKSNFQCVGRVVTSDGRGNTPKRPHILESPDDVRF